MKEMNEEINRLMKEAKEYAADETSENYVNFLQGKIIGICKVLYLINEMSQKEYGRITNEAMSITED